MKKRIYSFVGLSDLLDDEEDNCSPGWPSPEDIEAEKREKENSSNR